MSEIGQAQRRPILVAALALVVPIVVVAIWAADRAENARIRNPGTAVADARGRIWVLAGPSCILLDADGNQLQEWSAAELGVELPFAGIAALPDGGVAIGSYATGRVRFVGADGARGDEIDVRRGRRPEGSFQLWYDAASERLIVTDTPNHRVAVFDRRGALRAESRPRDFRFPNGVMVDSRGRIVVADTNHYRIALLDGALQLVGSLRVEDSQRFRFPVFVSSSDEAGGLLATVHSPQLTRAVLVRFDASGRRVQTIDLPAGCRPGIFARLDGAVLLPDRDGFQLLRLEDGDSRWSPFGRAAFTTRLERDRREWWFFRRLTWAALGGLVLLLVTLAGAYARGRRQEAPPPKPIDAWVAPRTATVGAPQLAVVAVTTLLVGIVLTLAALPRLAPRSGLAVPVLAAAALLILGCLALLAQPGWLRSSRERQLLVVCRRFRSLIGDLLAADEAVLLCAMARPRPGEWSLLVLCEGRMFALALDSARLRARRVQEIPYTAMQRVRLSPTRDRELAGDRAPWRRSAAFGGESAWLRFDIPRTGVAVALELALDDARRLQQFLAERESQQWSPDTLYERCPSCGRRNEACPECEPKRLGPFAAALVSAIVPGLGQVVNGSFLRGTLFLTLAGALGLVLIPPVRELVRRSTEVPVFAIVEVALDLLALWAFAVWDAWTNADTRRWRWGIRTSLDG
jgi:hypothetical protein